MKQIKIIVESAANEDGMLSTSIPFITFNRSSKPTAFSRGILTPSFCLIVRGSKQLQIGKTLSKYGPGDYSISTIHFPPAGQITGATRSMPYLGIRVELDPKEIATILIDAKIE